MSYGDSSSVRPSDACPYCSGSGSYVTHNGVCPKVAELEYHPNGVLKRVRFHEEKLNVTVNLDRPEWLLGDV